MWKPEKDSKRKLQDNLTHVHKSEYTKQHMSKLKPVMPQDKMLNFIGNKGNGN